VNSGRLLGTYLPSSITYHPHPQYTFSSSRVDASLASLPAATSVIGGGGRYSTNSDRRLSGLTAKFGAPYGVNLSDGGGVVGYGFGVGAGRRAGVEEEDGELVDDSTKVGPDGEVDFLSWASRSTAVGRDRFAELSDEDEDEDEEEDGEEGSFGPSYEREAEEEVEEGEDDDDDDDDRTERAGPSATSSARLPAVVEDKDEDESSLARRRHQRRRRSTRETASDRAGLAALGFHDVSVDPMLSWMAPVWRNTSDGGLGLEEAYHGARLVGR
jgi:hypothetical protein